MEVGSSDSTNLTDLLNDVEKLENDCIKLQKDLKKLVEAFEELFKLEKKSVSELRNCPLSNTAVRKSIESWQSFVKDLEVEQKNQVANIKNNVLDPMKTLLEAIENAKSTMRKRQIALQELSKATAKWKRIEKEGKFSVTTAQLNQVILELSEAKKLASAYENALRKNLSTIVTSKGDLLEPVLLRYAGDQLTFHLKNASALKHDIDTTRRHSPADSLNQLDSQLNALQAELDSLSIVGGTS